MKKVNGVIYINGTSHPIDMAFADPNVLDERKVDFTVDVDIPINIDFEDTKETFGNLTLLKREPVITDETLTTLFGLLNDAEKLKESDEPIVLIVSFATLSALPSNLIDDLKAHNTFVVSIVSATKRSIKPPVACATFFSTK